MFEKCDAGDEGKMRKFIGPMMMDHQIREAILHCWMMLPNDKKTVDAVEAEIRRVVDRALKDLREDATSFGITQ